MEALSAEAPPAGGDGATTAAAAPPPLPFSEADLATAVRVLEAAAADLELYQSKPLRGLRKAIAPILAHVQGQMYEGSGNRQDYAAKRFAKTSAAAKRQVEKLRDLEYINKTKLRAARIAKLAELSAQGGTEDHPSLPLVLDGAVEAYDSPVAAGNARKRALLADGTAVDSSSSGAGAGGSAASVGDSSDGGGGDTPMTGCGDTPMTGGDDAGAVGAAASSSSSSSSAAAAAASAPAADGGAPTSLSNQRACYICKRRYKVLHHFYDTLCPACADLNWRKRNQTADMAGRVALVTGARVKIGFQCVLRLLRCGATVIATTRFPVDAAARYAAQPDFAAWRDRLHLYGLDFRDMRVTEAFCGMLCARYDRLDAIVNNACQTVRRPPAYFAGLIAGEHAPLGALPDAVRPLVSRDHEFRGSLARQALLAAGPARAPAPRLADRIDEDGVAGSGSGGSEEAGDESALNEMTALPAADLGAVAGVGGGSSGSSAALSTSSSSSSAAAAGGALHAPAAALSQVPLLAGDHASSADTGRHFPAGKVDVNAQQLDLRTRNSWTLKLEEVETPELAEVFLINAMAPMVINARLKPLLMRGRVIPNPLPTVPPRPHVVNKVKSLAEEMMEEQEAAAAAASSSSSSAALPKHSGTGAAKLPHRMRGGGPLLGEVAPPVPVELVRWVVNVSAMEGKFSRYKTPDHPHTNAAKAALNMSTRTSAGDWARDFIYMTAVDTGWINLEQPAAVAARVTAAHNFATPLDEVDAAARVLDPILEPLAEAQAPGGAGFCSPIYGAFLKDYRVTEW